MASKANFSIEQGTDVEIDVNIDNSVYIDITDFTVSSRMKKHYLSETFIDLGVSVSDSNTIVIALSANASANIEPGRYVYEVKMTSDTGITTRVVEGIITVTPGV